MLVNVYYSYFIWIVFILQNQFSSLKYSDELLLTFICTLVYNILMLPGLLERAVWKLLLTTALPLASNTGESGARKSIDPVRFMLLSSTVSNATATSTVAANS